jgi:hypothetical protein
MVQPKVKVKVKSQKSKVKVTLRPTASQSVCLVPSPLGIKGVPSKKFQFDIRKFTLKRFLVLPLGGLQEKQKAAKQTP